MKEWIFYFMLFPISIFCQPFGTTQTFIGPKEASLILADLTGDSIPEMVTSYYSEAGPYVMVYYTGLERDTFAQPPISIANYCRPQLVKDIDSDGDIDIIAFEGRVTLEGNHVIVFLNDGIGNFIASDSISYRAPVRLFAEDIDSSGVADLIIANGYGIHWYAQEQPGEFTEEGYEILESRNIFGRSYPIAVGDIDGDNDIDILATDEGEEIIWIKNEDRGNFYTTRRVSDYLIPGSLALKDLDEDGDLDVVTFANSRILWYKNNGEGGFSRSQVINTFGGISGLFYHIVDLDLDGDQDFVIGTRSESSPVARKVSWIENYGEGRFSRERVLLTNLQATGVTTQDLDKDGFPEILATESYFYRLVYFENKLDEPSLHGTIYRDVNANGTFDSLDAVIPYFQVGITDNNDTLYTYTDRNGKYRFYLSQGSYQFLFPKDTSCLAPIIVDSTELNVTLETGQTITRNFILQMVTSEPPSLRTSLTSAPTRCESEVSFWLNVENITCDSTAIDGKVGLVTNELARFVNAVPSPITINGDTLFWSIQQLPSFQQLQIKIRLQIANTDYIGDTIHLPTIGYIANELGEYELSSINDFSSVLRCSYDPNDKLVNPLRDYPQNYTLFDEKITYTIRFQNTGNDTAYNVTIKDRLDQNLDWATFKPLEGSHSFESFLYEDGLVEFRFRNIFLPDSTTNAIESNGYVRYTIKAKEQLAENTVIHNTAKIFFDSNPFIQTNEVESVLVSALPMVSSTSTVSVPTFNVKVYPNPFSQGFSISFSEVVNGTFSIFDLTGKLLYSKRILNTDKSDINSLQFPSGIYFFIFIPDYNSAFYKIGKLIKY